MKQEEQQELIKSQIAVIKKLDLVQREGFIEIERVFQRVNKKGVEKLVIDSKYYPKGDLVTYVGNIAFLPYPKRVQMIAEIAKSLAFMHENGVIHRDIHPGNILVDEREQCRLTDFDVSSFEGKHFDVMRGATYHLAPELFHAEVSPALDIWALGITAFQLFLTSDKYPYSQLPDKITNEIIQKEAPFVQERLKEYVCSDYSGLIHPMLEVDPKKRVSAKEVARQADELLKTLLSTET